MASYCLNSFAFDPEGLEALKQALTGHQPALIEQQVDWFEILWRYIKKPGEDAQFYLLADQLGVPKWGLPLITKRNGLVRSLLPLANYYTSIFEPIKYQVGDELSLEALLVEVLASNKWDQMSLGPIDPLGSTYQSIASALDKQKIPYVNYGWFDNFFINVEGESFEGYRQRLPSRLKNTVKRKFKSLEKEFEVIVDVVSDLPDVIEALKDFEVVYANSWKKPEGIPDFIRDFCCRAARQGWLRIGQLKLDAKVLASQLWFVKDGRASIFKLAHDKSYDAYSIGTLLTYQLMEHMLDLEKVNYVDFLIGSDAYKKDWGFEPRKMNGLLILNPATFVGNLLRFRHRVLPRLLGRS